MTNYPTAIITIAIFVHVFFIIAQLKKDNSVMTFAWPVGLWLVGSVLFFTTGFTSEWQALVLYGALTLWAVRLFGYTLWRNLSRGYEDFRYKSLRDSMESGFLVRSYIQFFLVQGIFMFLISLTLIESFQEGPVSTGALSTILLVLGIIVFIVGFFVEVIGDEQLRRFKSSSNPDDVFQTGLWKYSRHPNYFGEALVWWGLFLIGFGVTNVWWTIVSPLLLTLSLRYLSGVPMVEDRYKDNEAYKQYQSQTNAFIPSSPRNTT